MSQRRQLPALDRLIRVREIRARQAMAASGRVEARRQAEMAMLDRVDRLIARNPAASGPISAQAASARAASDGVLGVLADNSRSRLAATCAEQARLTAALAEARAAVDAALTRRRDREEQP